MNRFFRGYILTNNKHPIQKFTDGAELLKYDEVKDAQEYAGVLAPDAVLVDIDDKEQANVLADIVEEMQFNCQMRETDRGIHFYFINGGVDKCYTGVYLACGIKADIKVGCKNSISVLKKNGKEREVVFDKDPKAEYDVIPKWLLPIDSKDRGLYHMKDGDGRDSTLYAYILTLVQHGFTKDECRETLTLINKHIFTDKLKDKDIERITREDAFPADTFFEKGKFLHDKFGDYLISEHKIRRIDGVLCYYHNGEYVNATDMMDNLCLRHLRSLPAKSRTEVAKYIGGILAESVPSADPRFITFNNGVLDIETMQLSEPTSDVITRNIIRHDYKADAYCSLTDRTLDKISCYDPQVRAIIEECIGYGMYRRNELSKAFIFTGEKANGKSTLMDVLQYLYGDGNCSNLDIGELDERFSTAELAGKLVNIGDDISDEFLSGRSISMFKKIVSGNPLKGEYKGENIFFFKPYVKLFFSANEIPRMKDKTGAVLRRMVIIPFNARFTPDDPDYDPYIVTKLKSEESVQYLIRLGIAGLKRVLVNKDFTHATVVAKALAAYELENNPILSFINDVTVEGIVERPTDDVYKQYCVYCYENGFKALSKNPFSKELMRNAGVNTKVVKVAGKCIRQYIKIC